MNSKDLIRLIAVILGFLTMVEMSILLFQGIAPAKDYMILVWVLIIYLEVSDNKSLVV